MMRGLHFVLGCLCGFAVGGAAAVTVPAVPISVVDAESGTPVAGAYVIYRLTAEEGTLTGHGGKTAVARLVEVRTDANGQATIPAGDFERWPFWGGFHWSMPKLLVFKGGYLPETVDWSYGQIFPDLKDIVGWPQAQRPVKMKKPAREQQLFEPLRWFGNDLERLYGRSTRPKDQCGWHTIPRTIVALEDEVMRLETAGARQSHETTPLRNLLSGSRGDGCGAATSFFQSFAPACPGSTELMSNFERTVVRSMANGSPVAVTQGYCAGTGRWWIAGDQRGWQAVPGPVPDPGRRY